MLKCIRIGGPLIMALLVLGSFRPPAGTLNLEVGNVKTRKGTIWVGIYKSESSFMVKEEAILASFKVRDTGQIELDIAGLPYGTYALALFHDINNNGELDRNFFGIPSEPYAFSRKPKSKWRLPKFEEVKFHFSHSGQELEAPLEKW